MEDAFAAASARRPSAAVALLVHEVGLRLAKAVAQRRVHRVRPRGGSEIVAWNVKHGKASSNPTGGCRVIPKCAVFVALS